MHAVSASSEEPAANAATSAAVRAPGGPGSAGSPGRPAPAGTGEQKSSPVTGCGRGWEVVTISDQRPGDAVEDVADGGVQLPHRHPPEHPVEDEGAGADDVGAAGLHVGQAA